MQVTATRTPRTNVQVTIDQGPATRHGAHILVSLFPLVHAASAPDGEGFGLILQDVTELNEVGDPDAPQRIAVPVAHSGDGDDRVAAPIRAGIFYDESGEWERVHRPDPRRRARERAGSPRDPPRGPGDDGRRSGSARSTASGIYELEHRVLRADGEWRWMAVRGVPVMRQRRNRRMGRQPRRHHRPPRCGNRSRGGP